MPRDIRHPRYARLRALLIEARKGAGLSQAVVAERLRRPQSYIADIERNERRVDIIEFLALAEAIGFDPAEMLREVASINSDEPS
ncbi:transcriptional regulator [Azorhizobium oxalatiphilum]|uniref:Transcriptional regulator n=1 Tax=Azorhizobium oxalatiphilum TaxID=980631 RepID=A0A917C7G5_9HYPH|nr:helix-turn-helix transcriptional regulator [Azorhizobium oxalatiphilum]GGF74572.1 transcriptional regulator [Azorhizobium oxalatiphilum]